MSVLNAVMAAAGAQLGLDKVNPSDTLRGLGADSLDVLEVVMEVEGVYGIVVPDSELENSGNITLLALSEIFVRAGAVALRLR